ncbi:MAG: type IV pilin-like G/H family protein [Dolichospermum sp. DET50]|nr:type IV pilin-like G/H family protein [Dolichospermum sp. DET66]MBS3032441.1 type IV pilin-like G/H family protein [Dolichospermum sp. DET67]MBS3037646.1 type IV pilin-like G/H family protein [Dolichospermum sp. DET50]QSX70579.1 MAG: type IV pilin-like G/H family protein [Dolichospermum sp. DET69]
MNIKFFQYLLSRKNERGFTIIEILSIVIIIGILSAIALPSFLSCGSMAVSSESKYYVGAMNESQQAYFLENRNFSNSLSRLDLGIKEQTKYFNYSIIITQKAAFNYGVARQKYVDSSWFNPRPIKTFVGAVFAVPITKKDQPETLSIICQSQELTTTSPANPILKNGVPVCGQGTKELLNKEFIK